MPKSTTDQLDIETRLQMVVSKCSSFLIDAYDAELAIIGLGAQQIADDEVAGGMTRSQALETLERRRQNALLAADRMKDLVESLMEQRYRRDREKPE